MELQVRREKWALKTPFRISGREWRHSECIVVELRTTAGRGHGEAQGVSYLGESIAGMVAQIEAVRADLEQGISRHDLSQLLPAGGARNAVDCALWDLEAKSTGRSIWQLLGLEPRPVTTVFTIGLEATPRAMAEKAAAASAYPILKIKLDADQPLERLAAIRTARPDARLVVDVNQGWTIELLRDLLPECAALPLEMIEQPLPRGADDALEQLAAPVLLAADESCQDRTELAVAARRYGMINIKLDKTGGLSEALQLVAAARELGCKLMVGNMLGTSLGMAPSFVIAQYCDFVDIDGPLLLEDDREYPLRYAGPVVSGLNARLWG